MDRKISSILSGERVIDDGDMLLYRAIPSTKRISVGPFLFLDHQSEVVTHITRSPTWSCPDLELPGQPALILAPHANANDAGNS
jgi:hypothetical protein